MNLAVVLFVAGLCMLLGGLIDNVICENGRSARDRRQGDTQRQLNAASADLRRQVHEVDVLLGDVQELVREARHSGRRARNPAD